MRAGIDATWAGTVGTGTGSYTAGLVRALVKHADHEFVLYFRPGDDRCNPLFALDGPNVSRRLVGGWGQPGRTLAALSIAAGKDTLDVFHSPGYFLPIWPGPKVVTFHDVNMFLQWDKWWRTGMRASWLSLCSQTLLSSRLARRILADSAHTAEAVRNVLHVADERITILYPGVDDLFFDPPQEGEAGRLRERHDLSEYLLFVSVLSPQKNLAGVVRAFARLPRGPLKLAIVGREDGPYYRQVVDPLIKRLGLDGAVCMLGTVPAPALPGLYAGARALLYPSFAEGFGLPPLEAMASGTPVIASNRTSLPEVLDGAAILVNPDDVEALARATDQLLSDPALRDDLIERGRRHVAQFRWTTAARKALEIYAAVA